MAAEQALALAEDESPVFVPGALEVIASMFKDEPKVSQAFRTGRGVGWHEHSSCLFRGRRHRNGPARYWCAANGPPLEPSS
jgi:hypothetical protein